MVEDENETLSVSRTVMSFRLSDCEMRLWDGRTPVVGHDAGITDAASLTTGGRWWRRGGTGGGGGVGGYLCVCGGGISMRGVRQHLVTNEFQFQWTFFARKSTWIWEVYLAAPAPPPLTTSCFNWPAEGSPGLFWGMSWLVELRGWRDLTMWSFLLNLLHSWFRNVYTLNSVWQKSSNM